MNACIHITSPQSTYSMMVFSSHGIRLRGKGWGGGRYMGRRGKGMGRREIDEEREGDGEEGDR